MSQFAIIGFPLYKDAKDLGVWAQYHAAEHVAFTAKVLAIGAIPYYIPVELGTGSADWFAQHNQMHIAELHALGYTGSFDLQDAIWTEEGYFYDWMQYHAAIHADERTGFGL